MGKDKNGDIWCDFDGREILRRPVTEKNWTFHSFDCRDKKLRLLHKSEQTYGQVLPIRSIYQAQNARIAEGEED
jgi:hypothetical protein